MTKASFSIDGYKITDMRRFVLPGAEHLFLALLTAVAICTGCTRSITDPMPQWKADLVVVNKSQSRLYLQSGGKNLATYKVSFGGTPQGHKQTQGDERTPEGSYVLDFKNAQSAYYRSIHISYPNAADRLRAQLTATDPGGDIMIHGQRNGWGWLASITQLFDWTDGCIALSNSDMDTVWRAVDAGTPISIRP